VLENRITPSGQCPSCQTPIPSRWSLPSHRDQASAE